MTRDARAGGTPDWRYPALCHWFAGLYASELSQEQLLAYQRGEGDAVLAALAEIPGLEKTVARLRSAFNGLTLMAHPRLELAADFASLFLLDGRHSAPPYGSVYTSGGRRFFAEPQERMQERLAASQQEVSKEFREPSDHLSVMLEYLGNGFDALINNTDQPAQAPTLEQIQAFVDEELLNWLPAFAARCEQVTTVSDVYPALARLLLKFCTSIQALAVAPTAGGSSLDDKGPVPNA